MSVDLGIYEHHINSMSPIGFAAFIHEELHTAPRGHPENADRFLPAVEYLLSDSSPIVLRPFESNPLGLEDIPQSIHDRGLLDYLADMAERGGGQVDADTYVARGSIKAALTVAGALRESTRLAFSSDSKRHIIVGRPPGHHAEHSRAGGFCLINLVAIAAQWALDNTKANRVAIVDFDVHHGNGTQQIFYERDDVFYASVHLFPFFPGTGAAGECGVGPGAGTTLNLPLPAGSGNDELREALDGSICEAIRAYAPDVILVSAGFDGHVADPLGMLAYTEEGFRHTGRTLAALSDDLCNGRLVSFVEGGYNPEANKTSLTAYLKGMQAT